MTTKMQTSTASDQSSRMADLLEAPITSTLLKLAAPNVVAFFVASGVSIAEMWYVGKLGTPALAGFAIIFPMVMLMQMLSAGSIGGVIAATTARAMGAGDASRANRIVWMATFFAVFASVFFFVFFKEFGEAIVSAIGAQGESLTQAIAYGDIVFAGILTVWLFNIFSSLLRGAGNMRTPALGMALTAVVQIVLSGALTLGWFGLPALGIAGVGWGMVLANIAGVILTFVQLQTGRSGITFRKADLYWDGNIAKGLFKVGGMAAINPFLTVLSIILLTGLVSRFGEAAIAGFGIGARLEFILIPIVFGLGAAMISLVGGNIGAGRLDRAQRVGWIGGGMAALACGGIGAIVAMFPQIWAGFFTDDAAVYSAATSYLIIVGPFYAFFGLGLSLYFASQGAHAVFWPVLASLCRLGVAIGAGSYAVQDQGASYDTLLMFVAASVVVYGGLTALPIALGAWRRANRHIIPQVQS